MPDLSSYIDFSVRFDLTTGTPTMILTDTSSYPSGVEEDITGYFSITSPDMGTDSGSWSSPDVTWNGDELTTKELILRLNDNGNIQAGDYTVVYNVHHPSYTPTVLSRTFNTSYVPPKLNLVNKFDVFTPSLKYQDQTNYGIPGYSLDDIERLWIAYSIITESISSSDVEFDVIIEGDYWDSAYDMYFSYIATYISDIYSYLTIQDFQEYTFEASANTPPSIDELVGYLNDLKDELDANVNNDSLYSEYKSRYEYASSLLFNIKESCRVELPEPLNRYVSEFLSITNNFVTPPYTNTNQIIEPYDCGSAGAASTYKVYTALVYQAGTSEPVTTILQDDFGYGWDFIRVDAGNYQLQSLISNQFTANKTIGFVTISGGANSKIANFTQATDTLVQFAVLSPTTGDKVDLNGRAQIEIRVYN
jgi:hypothetical protein